MTFALSLTNIAASGLSIAVVIIECLLIAAGGVGIWLVERAILNKKKASEQPEPASVQQEEKAESEPTQEEKPAQPVAQPEVQPVVQPIPEPEPQPKPVVQPEPEKREKSNAELLREEMLARRDQNEETEAHSDAESLKAELLSRKFEEEKVELEKYNPILPDEQRSEGGMSELQRYIAENRQRYSGNAPQPEEEEPLPSSGYINPNAADNYSDGTFGAYEGDSANEIKRHIMESRKKYAPDARPEQEKVDWQKVKDYNSAIMFVSPTLDDDDEKKGK